MTVKYALHSTPCLTAWGENRKSSWFEMVHCTRFLKNRKQLLNPRSCVCLSLSLSSLSLSLSNENTHAHSLTHSLHFSFHAYLLISWFEVNLDESHESNGKLSSSATDDSRGCSHPSLFTNAVSLISACHRSTLLNTCLLCTIKRHPVDAPPHLSHSPSQFL